VFATGLRLADGTTWSCAATGDGSKTIVRRLTDIMQLRPMTGPCDASVVVTSGEALCRDPRASLDVRVVSCLADISLAVAEAVQARGGLLLHGGLAENQPGGYGAILAGPSGAGKSTASRRLHRPWRSLSDDAVLVVRDRGGAYRAHPWPTRSAFLPWGSGGTWDVGYAVLLKGIFYLEHGECVHEIGRAHV
jgi:SynChlorMet cassette protein ScmC